MRLTPTAVHEPRGPILLTPSILAVAHWNRLLDGILYATSPRVDWATLMRRTFAVDVQQCRQCLGKLRVIANITEPDAARKILQSVAFPLRAPPAARARDPADEWAEEARDEG